MVNPGFFIGGSTPRWGHQSFIFTNISTQIRHWNPTPPRFLWLLRRSVCVCVCVCALSNLMNYNSVALPSMTILNLVAFPSPSHNSSVKHNIFWVLSEFSFHSSSMWRPVRKYSWRHEFGASGPDGHALPYGYTCRRNEKQQSLICYKFMCWKLNLLISQADVIYSFPL